MKWINVKDELPKDGEYLCVFIGWDDMRFQRVLEYYNDSETWDDWEGNEYKKVTHWMLLPKPPKQ